jgi:predicted dehydrogenase
MSSVVLELKRILVVGSGGIGRRHLRNARELLPAAKLGLLTRNRPADLSPDTEVLLALEEALAWEPDAVVIASPAPFHISVAIAFATRGAHLLIEKPLSNNLEGVDELIASRDRLGIVAGVGYNLRFNVCLEQMQRVVREGGIGRPIHGYFEAGQFLPDWRPHLPYQKSVSAQRSLGGGVLLELSHEVDLASWMLGQAQWVSASVRRVTDLEIDVEDTAQIQLGFASGAVGQLHLDFIQRPGGRLVRIVGMEGTMEWRSGDTCWRLARRTDGKINTFECELAKDSNHSHQRELATFFGAVQSGTPMHPSIEEGRTVLKILEACGRSSALESREKIIAN